MYNKTVEIHITKPATGGTNHLQVCHGNKGADQDIFERSVSVMKTKSRAGMINQQIWFRDFRRGSRGAATWYNGNWKM